MRLSCPEIEDRVAPWLDEELAPAEAELVAAHLEGCAACAELVARLDGQRFERPRLAEVEAPAFWARMDEALGVEVTRWEAALATSAPKAAPWWRRELRVSALAAAAALALIGGLAGALAWQATEAAAGRAELAAVRAELEAQAAQARPEPVLPREPMVLVSHTPFHGRL